MEPPNIVWALVFFSLFLLLAGDVASNPGPAGKKIPLKDHFPCAICENPVTWSTQGVCCDDCSVWHHLSCTEIPHDNYENLENVTWKCHKCNSINLDTFTFHNYSLNDLSTNPYFPIQDSNISLDSLPSSCRSTSTSSHTEATNKNNFSPIKASTPTSNNKSHHTSTMGSLHLDALFESSTACRRTRRNHSSDSNPYDIENAKGTLRVINLNAWSIRNKLPEFHAMLSYVKPDVVCCTESWLHGKKPGKNHDGDAFLDTELISNEYKVYRHDRNEKGGGVFILVKNTLVSVEEPQIVTDCEIEWVKIYLKGRPELHIGCFYMPHRNSAALEQLDLSLANLNKSKFRHIILCGDFNCPAVDWEKSSVKDEADQPSIQQELLDLTIRHGLTQVVDQPTRKTNILDLCFTTNSSLITSTSVVPGISDHDIVVIDSVIKPQYQHFKKRKMLIYNKANWPNLKGKCKEISSNITTLYNADNDDDSLFECFSTSLDTAIDVNIPSKYVTNRNNYPWMNNDLKKMIRVKNRLRKQAKATKNWDNYYQHQKECKLAFRKAELEYINNSITEGLKNNDTKPFWRYVKGRKQDQTGVSPLFSNGKLKSNSKEKADILLNQFSSVFNTETSAELPETTKRVEESVTDITIEMKRVEGLLKKIKASKASGPDNIPNRVLKECAAELAPAIAILFQQSLNRGILPEAWTSANISPVFKKGDRHRAENYRPVSLTSVLSKLLEHIVCSNMLKHLTKNKVLTDLNHGFRSGFSCETQLAVTLDELTRNHDKGFQTDVAILDFSKAFDTVPHDKLLHKLEAYGIRGSLLDWVRNFLTGRKMKVVVDGEQSEEAEVLSGVPQGTVLGPLLFLCHINDLPDCVSSIVRLFADDCLLYRTIKTQADHIALQEDLNKLEEWANKWGMKFNASKCYILSINQKSSHYYQLNNTFLQEVEDNPYLGLTISNDLSWSKQIDKTAKKASSSLGFIRRNLSRCPKETRLQAYLSLVRSLLEYGAVIWDPSSKQEIKKLERIQRQSARFVNRDYRSREKGCMTKMLKDLELPTLQQRRKELRLSLLYKISEESVQGIPRDTYLQKVREKRNITATKKFDDYVHKNMVANYVTNNSKCYKIPPCNNPAGPYSQSFFPRTVTEWNKLNDKTVPTCLVIFWALYQNQRQVF